MARRRQIYEGKAKILFEGPEPGTLVQYFKDDATAFNAQKKGVITGKGVINNRISEYLMLRLGEIGIPTHFIRRLNMREQLIREVEIIPLEVVVRNIAAGSLSNRLGIPEGTRLPRSIIEYYYKNDALNDPMVSEEHITAFGWASPQDLDDIVALSLRINDFLTGLFLGVGIVLVDFKLEFGRLWENDEMRIVLADEINRASPKTQAALLEAMEERQVTVDGVTHVLPSPFMVIATQNPVEHVGTYPLPDSQLDRFLLRIEIGYPEPASEVEMLERHAVANPLETLEAVVTGADVEDLVAAVRQVYVAPALRGELGAAVSAPGLCPTRLNPVPVLRPPWRLSTRRTFDPRTALASGDRESWPLCVTKPAHRRSWTNGSLGSGRGRRGAWLF
jgi:phosphoribosylaminoimidazole-succinocarboxamide synthase